MLVNPVPAAHEIDQPQFLVFQTRAYPSWTPLLDGHAMTTIPRPDGLIAIALPPRADRVSLRWSLGRDRWAGGALSLLALMALLASPPSLLRFAARIKSQRSNRMTAVSVRDHHEPGSADARAHYLPGLDGWRAIAILWVVISHNPLWVWGGFNDIWIKNSGERGVGLFFALSGLLICNRLLLEEQRRGRISIGDFYLRRVFRIQPAALTYLAVLAILMICGVLPHAFDGVVGAALMVRNYWPRSHDAAQWFSGHFWSLAVEEHFYLLLPSFLFFVRRRRITVLACVIVIVEIWRFFVYSHTSLQNIGVYTSQRTDIDIGEILLGCIFALALERQQVLAWARALLKPWAALMYAAVILLLLAHITTRLYHPPLITIYPVLIASTMLHPRSVTTRLLELPPVRFLGRISFSLYLWQQLFFNPESPAALHTLRSYTALAWMAAIACSIASYYIVERPIIRYGHRRLHRPQPA